MHPGHRNRVHNTRVAQRDIQILCIQRLLVSQHQRLRKRNGILRKHARGRCFQRISDRFRKIQHPVWPDAGLFRRFLYRSKKINAARQVRIRLLAVALGRRAKLHTHSDLVAGTEFGTLPGVIVQPCGQMRQHGVGQAHGDPDGMLVFLRIRRHARRDRPLVVRDCLYRLQTQVRRAKIPAKADGRRNRCKHDPHAHAARQQKGRQGE